MGVGVGVIGVLVGVGVTVGVGVLVGVTVGVLVGVGVGVGVMQIFGKFRFISIPPYIQLLKITVPVLDPSTLATKTTHVMSSWQ